MSRILNQQAEQLYTRGVAAARGGQKSIAASLLRQAVKLNPQHEQAWLWLSGVLDKPEDVSFCLRSVLGINPHNTRAQRGLTLLEQQLGEAPRPAAISPALAATTTTPDSWWANWRTKQSTWLWTFRALLLIPIVLLGATLAMRTVILVQPLPTFASAEDIPIPTAVPTIQPTIAPPTTTPALTATPTSRSVIATYFETINQERTTLQTATEAYRTTTDGGRTAVERATATRQLRDQVQKSREALAAMQAPPEVAAAHQLYVEGLTWEQEALEQVLEFYQSYDVALANRAALRLQDARIQIATATASWDAFAKQQGMAFSPAGSR